MYLFIPGLKMKEWPLSGAFHSHVSGKRARELEQIWKILLKILLGRNSNGQKTHEKMLTISGHKGNANQNHTMIPSHPC
jgi:hypothetical protein